MKPKVIFFGTPQFSAEVLDYLISQNVDIVAVVTRVDKPKGRSGKATPPPVKELILNSHPNIPLYQPIKASDPEFAKTLEQYNADLFVFVAYGEIIRENLLNMPQKACINLHASILPKYRGAAPVQYAIINGDQESGVTIMHMVKEMDAGNIIKIARTPITPDMTSGELLKELSIIGKKALHEVIEAFGQGPVADTLQNEKEVTLAPKITTETCRLNWNKSALELHNLCRAVTPKPGAWCLIEVRGKQRRLKIIKAHPDLNKTGSPGEILSYSPEELTIACSQGSLVITEVQPEGKKAMNIAEFWRGTPPATIKSANNIS